MLRSHLASAVDEPPRRICEHGGEPAGSGEGQQLSTGIPHAWVLSLWSQSSTNKTRGAIPRTAAWALKCRFTSVGISNLQELAKASAMIRIYPRPRGPSGWG